MWGLEEFALEEYIQQEQNTAATNQLHELQKVNIDVFYVPSWQLTVSQVKDVQVAKPETLTVNVYAKRVSQCVSRLCK